MGFYKNDATAANNTALNGINAQGGASPRNIDDLIRELAAQGKQFALDIGGATTVGGTADAITISANDTVADAYFDGMVIGFVAGSTNTTTTPTANVNSIGAEPIKKALVSTAAETALAAGDIQSGGLYLLRWRSAWDSGNGAWQLIDFQYANAAGFTILSAAEMNAADPADYTMVWLEDGLKSGFFKPITGNQTGLITGDPSAGIYRYANGVSNGSQGVFARIIDDYVRPEWWGAVPDAVLDGNGFVSTGTDSAAAINAMSLWAANTNNRPATAKFSRGRYAVGSPLILYTAFAFEGHGLEQTLVGMLPSFSGAQLLQTANITGTVDYFRLSLRHMKFVAEGLTSTKYGMAIAAARDCRFDNVFFDRFNQNVRLLGPCYYSRFNHCTFSGGIVCGVRTFSANSLAPNEISFYECRVNGGAAGYEFLTSASVSFNSIKLHNCPIEAHSGLAVRVAGSATGPALASNIVLRDIRVDSAVGGAGSFSFDAYTSAVVDNDYLSGVSDIVDNAPIGNIVYCGLRHEKALQVTITPGSIVSAGAYSQNITATGYRVGKWEAQALFDSGGITTGAICRLRGSTTDTLVYSIHNTTGATISPANFTLTVSMRRLKT